MSGKSLASVVAAVAFAVIAARDVRPAEMNPGFRTSEAPLRVNGALPPGHPAIPQLRLPPGHPPVEGLLQPRLPDGHPPIPSEPGCPGQRAMPDAGIAVGRDERAIIST